MKRLKKLVVWITALVAGMVAITALANDSLSFQAKVDHAETEKLNLLELTGSVDHENNAIDLEWNEMPDLSQPYTYKVYQKKPGSDEFQSISTADLEKEVKVLNVYPNQVCGVAAETITYKDAEGKNVSIPISASLKKWMEAPTSYVDENGNVVNVPEGFGKGLISVDIVEYDDYNADPNKYLKDENGNYRYDVIAFGIADCNGRKGLTPYSKAVTAEFIESGRGVFFGHDTVYTDEPRKVTAELAEEYMKMTVTGTKEYSGTKVVIERDGLLTKYPWDIGGVGTELTIPYAHTSRQIPNNINDVWMKFSSGPSEIGNFYLTTYNNLAMSQTGHSTGQATSDEQKILANTMFYLSQLTTETKIKDRSGLDVNPPTEPSDVSVSLVDRQTLQVSFSPSQDRGSVYEYYVEATGSNDGRVFRSNTIKLENSSGLKGYSITVDDKPDTIPDDTIETTKSSFTIDYSPHDGDVYVHIAAVDHANNKSVTHIKIEQPKLEIKSSTDNWTNKDIQLTIIGSGVGLEKIRLPDGTVVHGKKATYTVKESGVYTFYGLSRDEEILTVSSYAVNNIDRIGKKANIIPNDVKWRNHDVQVRIDVN